MILEFHFILSASEQAKSMLRKRRTSKYNVFDSVCVYESEGESGQCNQTHSLIIVTS